MRAQAPLFDEIGDPQARREDDFYETKRWQTMAFLRRVRLDPSMRLLEPCAGNGAISSILRAEGLRVWANDLVPRDYPLDSTLDAAGPALWNALRALGHRVDVVVTNVPFSLALPIIDNGIAYARVAVCSVLRSTWDEPTKERCEWLRQHPPTAQIAMPRADYRGNGDSESATHHWFIWSKVQGFADFHHDTVTWAERDDLVARYGGGR